MKRLICFLTLSLAVCLSGRIAYAQHGHGAGGGVPAAAMSSHGNADAHGNAGNTNASTSNSSGTELKTASARLTSNQHLNDALTEALGKDNLVPTGGLVTACRGSWNLGRCISAIHVAHNRKLDFFCLKQVMMPPPPTGTTKACSATQTNLKLGQAIQALDPNADSKAEATKATKQANTDIDTASQGQT